MASIFYYIQTVIIRLGSANLRLVLPANSIWVFSLEVNEEGIREAIKFVNWEHGYNFVPNELNIFDDENPLGWTTL